MVTKAYSGTQRCRQRRPHRAAKLVVRHCLLVLLSHTLATIVITVVSRLLHVPAP